MAKTIAACNGDLELALKALTIANEFLSEELTVLYRKVSSGYFHGKAARPARSRFN